MPVLLLSLVAAQAQGLERKFGTLKLWPYLSARGFVGAASMTLYYEGIARMPLADAVGIPLYGCLPSGISYLPLLKHRLPP